MDEDLVVALRLQEEWDARAAQRAAAREQPSLVDASWELADPTPDLQALFVQFNDRFFWGRLEAVEVKWSVRMTLRLRDGRPNRRNPDPLQGSRVPGTFGMDALTTVFPRSFRGSSPLSSCRTELHQVDVYSTRLPSQTLLHEMIHAYLFVTNNDKDREGHGPEFCKHMHRINSLTGANITVYHTFHDEVDEYRRHWWRCNGPCQHRQPYYGYVRRATNRAPSAHDFWWAEHQKTCGGTYIKIKEPENYSKKGRGKAKPSRQPASAAEGADKPSRGEAQPLVPFSGKGYVLGKRSGSPVPEKAITSHTINETKDLFNQGHSADALRSDSNIEVKFEQNGLSKKLSHLVSPVVSTSHQSVLSSYFPRVSVANQKAFRSGSGSPIASGTIGSVAKHAVSSGSQRRVPTSKISLRNSSRSKASASAAAAPGGSGSKERLPSKRPRLEDKTVLDNFFIKKEQMQSGGSDLKSSLYPAAAGLSSSSSCAQSQLVSCPVCQNEVLESQINEHLDWCLEGDGLGARS